MARNKYKEMHMNTPIEKHNTAPWANTEQTIPVSNVNIPNEIQVLNAKEHVDTNEK